jgi:hypothetical protein
MKMKGDEMLVIAIPTSDLSQLPQGVEVMINGEPVSIREEKGYLLWNDQRRRILDVRPIVDGDGVECLSYAAE